MKKYSFLLINLCLILLAAACSQEEEMGLIGKSDQVQITAELPQTIAATRAPITIGADHQLRCILEMWTQDEEPALAYREEVLVPTGQKPVFNFSLIAGDYDCLLWADFVKKNASSEEVVNDDIAYTHYEDTYYDTSELKDIRVKDPLAANLFDTDNCDAYFSAQVIEKSESESLVLNFAMERPLAKIVLKERYAENTASLKNLKVSYAIPAGFNVLTGEPTGETMTALLTKDCNFDGTSQVLFTGYLFTASTGQTQMGTISLGMTTSSLRNCEIPSGSFSVQRNQCMNLLGELIEGSGEVEPDPEPEELQIGSFFFNDGTWGNELTMWNVNNCVGIVYALGVQPGDDVSYYGEAGDGKTILGYVMSLRPLTATFEVSADNGRGSDAQNLHMYNKVVNPEVLTAWPKAGDADPGVQVNNDIVNNDGYRKTQILVEEFLQKNAVAAGEILYPFMQCFYDWQQAQAVIPNTSGWYIPSARQYLVAGGMAHGFVVADLGGNDLSGDVTEDIPMNQAFSQSFSMAKDQGIAEDVIPVKSVIVGNSSLSNSGDGPTPIHFETSKNKFNRIKEGNGDKNFMVRPVLTILK